MYIEQLYTGCLAEAAYYIESDGEAAIIDPLRETEPYLKMAEEWSKLSYCKRRQVGSLIVKDKMIISDGYNGTPSGFENFCEDEDGYTKWYVLHAEANAIAKVSGSTQSTNGATLYITLSPCKECSKLIFQSGISRVVYSKKYKDQSGIEFLIKSGVNVDFIEI